jgi:hypothetical protein
MAWVFGGKHFGQYTYEHWFDGEYDNEVSHEDTIAQGEYPMSKLPLQNKTEELIEKNVNNFCEPFKAVESKIEQLEK